MIKFSEFRHNHHPSEVRMLAKFIRRGFSEPDSYFLLLSDSKDFKGSLEYSHISSSLPQTRISTVGKAHNEASCPAHPTSCPDGSS